MSWPRLALVAVIIPVYQRTLYLEAALASVARQSFADWRAYIVDDGSTNPEIKQILKRWSHKDQRFHLLRQVHGGVSAARNLGLAVSREPWIALLDSDDEWHPDKLSVQLTHAEQNPGLWHTEERWLRRGVRVNPKKKHAKGGGDQFAPSTRLCVISPSAALFPRQALSRWGIFDETMPVAEDYDLWLRVTAHEQVGFVTEALTIKKGGHANQLSRRPLLDYWQVKALNKILRFGELNQNKKAIALEQMHSKMEILEKGAHKNGNHSLLNLLAQWSKDWPRKSNFHSKSNFHIEKHIEKHIENK